RPRENLLIPEHLLVPRSGRYVLKLTEPMEEVAYLDSVRLVAYDLAPGWQMVLDERKEVGEPATTGQPRFFRRDQVPIRAFDDEGRDEPRAIQSVDGWAARPGRFDPRFIGLTNEHALTLEFDSPLDGESGRDGDDGGPLLIGDGWIEYPYAQTLFAAWQAVAA